MNEEIRLPTTDMNTVYDLYNNNQRGIIYKEKTYYLTEMPHYYGDFMGNSVFIATAVNLDNTYHDYMTHWYKKIVILFYADKNNKIDMAHSEIIKESLEEW